jgi:beta-mannosidase
LTAGLIAQPGGDAVVVSCERWAQAVAIEIERYLPADNYFHLEPGERRIVPLRRLGDNASPRGRVTALNSDSAVSFGQVEALRAG